MINGVMGDIFIWKINGEIRACYIYAGGFRTYKVICQAGIAKKEINKKIQTIEDMGFTILIGMPPPPPPLPKREPK